MSKKNKYKKWNDCVNVKPFCWDLFIVRPSSLAAFKKHLKANGVSKKARQEFAKTAEDVFTEGGACFWNDQVVIFPEEWNEKYVWHEALHVAIIFWEHAGASLKLYRNQEVLTYTQGHIVDIIRDKINNTEKGKE